MRVRAREQAGVRFLSALVAKLPDVTGQAHPRDGQVYVSPTGGPMLYVRTEKRAGSGRLEHLFVQPRDRVVFDRWVPADKPLPEEMALAVDPLATGRAELAEAELSWLRRERRALTHVMKRAVGLLPEVAAAELRREYREALSRVEPGRP